MDVVFAGCYNRRKFDSDSGQSHYFLSSTISLFKTDKSEQLIISEAWEVYILLFIRKCYFEISVEESAAIAIRKNLIL